MDLAQRGWLVRAKRAFGGIPLALLGAALVRTWVRVMTPLLPSSAVLGELSADNLFDVSGALVALVLALASRRLGALHGHVHGLLACAIAMSLAIVLVGIGNAFGSSFLLVLAAVSGGVGFMTLSIAWTTLYMMFNPARMVFYYCVSQLLSNVLIFAFEGYGAPQIYCALAVLPPIAWGMLRRSESDISSEDRGLCGSDARPFPWKLTLFLTVYTFAYSIASSASNVLLSYPALFLYLIPPLLFVVGVVFEPGRLSLRSIYAIACFVMMCALLLPIAFPGLPTGISAAFISLGYNASSILAVLFTGSISYRLGISALWIMGITRFFSYAGRFAGDWCYQALELDGGGISATLSIMLAVCVVVASLMLLTERDLNANWRMVPAGWLASSPGGVGPGPNAEDSAGASPLVAIAQARELYGLTPREEEILCLLAQKKNVPAIAADMFLAQGTVKAHVQHIYQKMGVHSRKELEGILGVR